MPKNKTFTLIKNENGEHTEKVISFKAIKGSKEEGACKHTNILIDEDLWLIKCEKCGKQLDPIQYLVSIADEEDWIEYRLNLLKREYKYVSEILMKKKHTKCEHCGKMTRIIRLA